MIGYQSGDLYFLVNRNSAPNLNGVKIFFVPGRITIQAISTFVVLIKVTDANKIGIEHRSKTHTSSASRATTSIAKQSMGKIV